MKNYKFLPFLIALVVVTSCSDENTKVSPTKTKAAFTNVNQDLAAELGDMQSSPGFVAMNSLSTMTSTNNPFVRISSAKPSKVKSYLKGSVASLRSMIVGPASSNQKVSSSEPFDYAANKGTYTWNGTGWTKSESTIIKIIFPTEGSATNNAEFQLTAYQEVYSAYTYEYNPTVVNATLNVDGVKQAEIDLNAEYDDYGDPLLIDLYVLFNPYSVEFNFDNKKSTSTSFSATLAKSNSTLIGVGLDVTYSSSSKSDSDIKSVGGYVQLMNIKFIVDIDATNPNATDINDIIRITIKVNGDTAGKVVFVQDTTSGDLVPYVKYTDGSTELLSTLFEDLAMELDGVL